MLIAADPHSSIDIDKLVGWLLAQVEQSNESPESFYIIDVNDYDIFMNSRIANAFHYDRILLCRHNYETQILAQARVEGHLLVIYGREAERVANVLFQRGYKTAFLRGTISLFKEQYPPLFEPSIDFIKLREIYDTKRNTVYGGRLWRSTSASRLKSIDRSEKAERSRRLNSTSSKSRIPRKPWH